MSTRLYPLLGEDENGTKVWYLLDLGMGMRINFFLQGWVWDSETRPRPAPLPSLPMTHTGRASLTTQTGGAGSMIQTGRVGSMTKTDQTNKMCWRARWPQKVE